MEINIGNCGGLWRGGGGGAGATVGTAHVLSLLFIVGGSRAFRATPRLPKGWPSWFAGAPNVASAPSGPGFGTLAG
jgi:hypothetical protein